MFTKIARLVKRRSSRIEVEATITPDIGRVQIVVVDEPQPQPESQSQPPPLPPPPPPQPKREVVDTAPDLLRWSTNLETPFPSVAFGGYIKYYYKLAHAADEPDRNNNNTVVHPLFNLPVHVVAPPPSSNPIFVSSPRKAPESSPTETVREPLALPPPPPPVKNPRSKARRFSLSSTIISEKKKPQELFRRQWKRASCIISSRIAEHDLSPLFNSSAQACRSPLFDMAGSLSSSKTSTSSSSDDSSSSSSSSSPPDSIAFEFHQSTNTSPDSIISTLPPNSPTSIYSNQDDNDNDNLDGGMIIMVESPKSPCSDLSPDTLCRPISSSSYGTAQSAFSQEGSGIGGAGGGLN